jgi:hypothetical protein
MKSQLSVQMRRRKKKRKRLEYVKYADLSYIVKPKNWKNLKKKTVVF